MATDVARAFGEQAVKVERIMQKAGVAGHVGRVVFLLAMADSDLGISQKQLIEATALPKDVVSKLVANLVEIKLLTQERDSTNSRVKRISTTDSGRKLLSRARAVLQPASPGRKKPESVRRTGLSLLDFSV
jgi:DNA-binding MarR family transcriptional regulator